MLTLCSFLSLAEPANKLMSPILFLLCRLFLLRHRTLNLPFLNRILFFSLFPLLVSLWILILPSSVITTLPVCPLRNSSKHSLPSTTQIFNETQPDPQEPTSHTFPVPQQAMAECFWSEFFSWLVLPVGSRWSQDILQSCFQTLCWRNEHMSRMPFPENSYSLIMKGNCLKFRDAGSEH